MRRKKHGTHTSITPQEFIDACYKRIKNIWGIEICLPSLTRLTTTNWTYWKAIHNSKSQKSSQLFLNGCLGQITIETDFGEEWSYWLKLLVKTGLGSKLSFSLGRFNLNINASLAAQLDYNTTIKAKRPLYIDQYGIKLSLQNENLILSSTNKEDITSTEQLPLRNLEAVYCSKPITFTSELITSLSNFNIPLVLSKNGTSLVLRYASNEFKANSTLALHHSVHNNISKQQQLNIAASWVALKIKSQAALIKNRYKAGDNIILKQLTTAERALANCTTLAQIRGWEGISSRRYFSWLAKQHELFSSWHKRQQNKKHNDVLNTLMNYGYSLLRGQIEVLIRAHHLDPYLGLLHSANGRHTALVSDFMEPFRALIDKLILRMVGLKKITAKDFEQQDNAIYISKKARLALIKEFNKSIQSNKNEQNYKLLEHLIKTYKYCIEESNPSLIPELMLKVYQPNTY